MFASTSVDVLEQAESLPCVRRCRVCAQAPCGKIAVAPSDFGLGETSIALRLHSPITANISQAIVRLREVRRFSSYPSPPGGLLTRSALMCTCLWPRCACMQGLCMLT